MEVNISIVQTNHPDFDEHFSRDVIKATRKDPKQWIAFFAKNLTDPNERKVIESILCTRECCQVIPLGGGNKSNIELIKEYLSSHYLYKYNIKSLENAVKLVCLMLNDGNKEIKDMVVSKHFG